MHTSLTEHKGSLVKIAPLRWLVRLAPR